MNPRGNFTKNSLIFVAKLKNIVVFVFTYVLEIFALFFVDFCIDIYSVDSNEAMKRWSDEAMKRGDEAMKRGDEALNASSFQFLSIGKRFIATISSQR